MAKRKRAKKLIEIPEKPIEEEFKRLEVKGVEMLPAIPPDDYKGSQAEWMTSLIERGLWDGAGWHGDVEIPAEIWWEILEQCEEDE